MLLKKNLPMGSLMQKLKAFPSLMNVMIDLLMRLVKQKQNPGHYLLQTKIDLMLSLPMETH